MNRFQFLFNLAALIPGLKTGLSSVSESSHFSRTMYRSNAAFPILKPDWPGNPVNPDGTFENHEFPFNPEFSKLLKWQTTKNPEKAKKEAEQFFLKAHDATAFLEDSRDGLCWLGHASFLIRMNGKLLAIDPVLDSPPFIGKRYSEWPLPKDFFPEIDYLLISHDHRDHLDENSLKFVGSKNPHAVVFSGLELSSTIIEFIPGAATFEAGWYQPFPTGDGLEIIFLPSRHWSRRGLFDTKKTLWGAFLIRKDGFSVYFGSDSGYGSHYKEVEELFGPPDIALLGIGAYKPEWFMNASHKSPLDALRAASDLQTKMMIPMHYGTFSLSDEPMSDPTESLKKNQAEKFPHVKINIPAPGEAVYF